MQHFSHVFCSETNFFLPPAPSCLALQYSCAFLKLSSFSLTEHKNMAGWYNVHWTYLHALHVPAWHRRLMLLTVVAAARRRVCLCSCVRPGEEEEAAVCWYWDLAAPATGPSNLLLCRVVLLYPPVVSGHERAVLPKAIQCKPLPLLSLHLLGNEYVMAKLHCFPLPQSNGEHSSLHYLPAPCLMWLTLSPTECQVHMLTSVRQLLSLPRGHCSSCPTRRTSASSSPRAPARNTASETTTGEWHTFWHQHSNECIPHVFEHPHRMEPKGQTCHWLAGFLLCSYDTKSEILMCQFSWGAWIHNYF